MLLEGRDIGLILSKLLFMSLCVAQRTKAGGQGSNNLENRSWNTRSSTFHQSLRTFYLSCPHILSILPLEHVGDTSNLSYYSKAQNVLLLI